MRKQPASILRRDAKTIFQAALDAAHAGNAVRAHLSLSGGILKAGSHRFSLEEMDRALHLAARPVGDSLKVVIHP